MLPFCCFLLIFLTFSVRYHLDEDPKTLRVLPIPLHDSKGSVCQYDHMSISPDGKVLAVTSGSTLQWLCMETGTVLDTAEKAHEGLLSQMSLITNATCHMPLICSLE